MKEFIIWCNENNGFMSALLSFFSIAISTVAIGLTVYFTKRQIDISLFEDRNQIYKNYNKLFNAACLVNTDDMSGMPGIMVFNTVIFANNNNKDSVEILKKINDLEKSKIKNEQEIANLQCKNLLLCLDLVTEQCNSIKLSKLYYSESVATMLSDFCNAYMELVTNLSTEIQNYNQGKATRYINDLKRQIKLVDEIKIEELMEKEMKLV